LDALIAEHASICKKRTSSGDAAGNLEKPSRLGFARPPSKTAPQSACAGKIKMMDEWPKTACGQIQGRHRDGQVEPPWPSASGIEIEHPVNRLDSGPMRVTANDDVDPARDWIELQRFDVVQDVDAAPAEGYHPGLRIMFRPVAGIDVPSDRNDRRNAFESGNNFRRTDIAGMNDVRHAREALLNLWTQ
jgi:hypothetical protein